MKLRNRLSLIIVALTLSAAGALGLLAYRTYTRQQSAQLVSLLRQDLERVAGILARPTIGAMFVDPDTDGYVLQLVTSDGQPVMAWGSDELLPSTTDPAVVQLGGRSYLVGQTEWGIGGGTIRLAHDIEAALASRQLLARNLILNATLVVLIATLVGLLTTRRQLAPLGHVSDQARSLDPAAPGAIDYTGPPDEIDDLVNALNASLGEIRARQDAERAFLLEVAHELAGPLTLVRYHLASVQLEQPGDQRLVAAAAAAKELLHSSQDLLILARGELERPLEQELFALSELLDRIQAEYPGVRSHVDDRGEVVGDPQRLMQAVRNLVRNAVQASGAAENVQVTISRDGDDIVLAVSDEGPGMRPETLARVFDHRFSEQRGVGVGLSVARSLVEQHGGTITAFSEVGTGSRFEVRVPSLASRLEVEPTGPGTEGAESTGTRH